MPGSGKTHTLAALVVDLLRSGAVSPDSEILIVTFTNSAVDNIRARVRRLLAEAGLPDGGYRVFTLHGLASSILRERPDLAGVAGDYGIDAEISGSASMHEAAHWYIQQNILHWRSFVQDLSAAQFAKVDEKWRNETASIGQTVTSLAKNLRLHSEELRALLRDADPLGQLSPFLYMGAEIYARYEHILRAGGRLDFDDLIWGAIRALESDASFCARLGARYAYVLEDEAQDSTPLQETILKLLTRGHGNWVRVGDPNQAIMTTFTSSNVRFFREFLARSDVLHLPLSVSGRSAPSIIDLANSLVRWSAQRHPDPQVRARALSDAVLIAPSPPGDFQPNPPNEDSQNYYVRNYADDEEEIAATVKNAARYVRFDRSRTCCILVPTNWMGEVVVKALMAEQQDGEKLFQDQLSNKQSVRSVARIFAVVAEFCARPTQASALAALYSALYDHGEAEAKLIGEGEPPGGRSGDLQPLLKSVAVERLLFPRPGEPPVLAEKVRVTEKQRRVLDKLGVVVARWLRASVLPIDQFLLTVAQDAFTDEGDLALAHSLAVAMRRAASQNPNAALDEFARQLDDIAANRQKFLSSMLFDPPFEPTPGVITVTTLHKAKGLEWDGVHIVGVNDVEFPDDVDGAFKGAAWYLGNREPVLEARTQLQALADRTVRTIDPEASLRDAHIEYICERMRLLYVGITRARRRLVLAWSQRSANGRGRERSLAAAVRAIT